MRPPPDLPPEANAGLLSLVVAEAAKRGLAVSARTELSRVHAAWFLYVALEDPDIEAHGRMGVDWLFSPEEVLAIMGDGLSLSVFFDEFERKVAEVRASTP